MRKCIRAVLLLGILFLGQIGCNHREKAEIPSYGEYREQEFQRLTAIRRGKVEKILEWLNEQNAVVKKEDTISSFYEMFVGIRESFAGGFDREQFLLLNNEIERFFVTELASFYDLLFIDEKGIVFYSVRLEDDFQTSLIDGPYSGTKLAEIIQDKPQGVSFVDFEYYGASDEPAAFYVMPVNRKNRHCGWIALQMSINKLNALLTNRSGLGRTGETYLVNENQMMLTESRFINNDTVLSKKIDTEAVLARKGQAGNLVIKDYRDVQVLSSYQSFQVDRTNWQILVERDEDEIITEYYQTYSGSLFPPLTRAVVKQTERALRDPVNDELSNANAKRADVGELVKTDGRNALYTYGVSTCTGIAAYIERGEWGYMAHCSPVDTCYSLSGNGIADGFIFLRDQVTDLVSLMMRRIQYFEITPSQIRDLRFVIVAPHNKSLQKMLDKLMDAGVCLSQIKAGILTNAVSASLHCDVKNDSIAGQWNLKGGSSKTELDFSSLPSLGDLVKRPDLFLPE